MNGSVAYNGKRRRIMHSQIFEMDAQVDASSRSGMADAVREMKKLEGHTGWLVRTDLDGFNIVQRYCQLLGVALTARAKGRGVVNVLSMRFETNQPFWYSSSVTSHGPAVIASGGNIVLTIAGEEDVIDAALTVTATSSVSSVTVEHDKAESGETINSQLEFTDTIDASDALVVDCGQYTVTNGGVAAADGFALDSTHNEVYWLRLPAGSNTLKITLGSGVATYILSYNPAYQ